ncbi:hypothetical protein P167DRAFT_575850 [Morchella conica CCBAS932]|uniref:Uncharacterized protein n=1 Tax=Morchella conica CCBAS932 TaxID=1392247 RepID=A0A3N4KJQ8_9PEZI|nr:hypothetical protein P167DRAFT_575850 [Morchella conica CCBAS932]
MFRAEDPASDKPRGGMGPSRFDILILKLLQALSETSPLSTELNPLTRTRRPSHPLLKPVDAPDRDTQTTSPSRLPLSTSYWHSVNSLEVSADSLPKPTITHGVSDLTVAKHPFLTLREVPSLGLTPLYGPSQATHLTESASPLTQPHRPGTTTEATPSRHGRHPRLRPLYILRKSSSKVTTVKTTNR